MKICVTGSAGFVGRRLVKRLLEDGHAVLPLDVSGGVDLTSWENLASLPAFEAMVHLAARTFVPDSFENPRAFYRDNVIGTLHALELCRVHGARCVYASSYVYGTPVRLPIDESHPVAAHNPYAQSKLIGEDLCRAYARDFSTPVCIVRPFNIYGPGQNERFIIPEMIRKAASGCIELKDPRPRRDFVHIDDVVEFYSMCLASAPSGAEVFNVGSGSSISVKELAAKIGGCLGNPEIRFTHEERPGEVLDTVADIDKAKRMLGWTPKVMIDDGLRQCAKGMPEVLLPRDIAGVTNKDGFLRLKK